jgi:hypothetical protein
MAELSEIEQRILLQRSRFPDKSSKEIASAIGISTSFVENFLKTRDQELSQSLPVQIKTDQVVSGRFSDGNVVLKFESGKTIVLGRISDLSGPPGPQGAQGPAGATGAAGANGVDGAISGRWKFNNNNSPPSVGSAEWSADTNAFDTLTYIMVDEKEFSSGANYSAWFGIIDFFYNYPVNVYLQITGVEDPSQRGLYLISGIVDNGDYWRIDLTYILHANAPANGKLYSISFVAMGVAA